LTYAITQLHAVEKIVHGFEQKQMQTRTGAETLQLVYGDFYDGQHMICYEVLHRRGLWARLNDARDAVRKAGEDTEAIESLADAMRGEGSPEEGWSAAKDALAGLLKALVGIRLRADAVDSRIASFHQLSRQRFFYQSQMRGRRPEMARLLCDKVNEHFAGQRFADLDKGGYEKLTAPWRGLLATEVEMFYGAASLRSPRRARQPVSLELSDAKLPPPDEKENARLNELMRAALTPLRAARLVQQIVPEPGKSCSTDAMRIDSDEMFLNLVAAASFNHAFISDGILRWQVKLSHEAADIERNSVPRDMVADEWQVERFTLSRRS
jgi:hypothetical protein